MRSFPTRVNFHSIQNLVNGALPHRLSFSRGHILFLLPLLIIKVIGFILSMTIIILLDIIGFKKFLFFLPLFLQHNHLIFQFPKLILVFMSFLLVDVDHFVHDLEFLYKYSQIHFSVLVFNALHHALVPICDPLVCYTSRKI